MTVRSAIQLAKRVEFWQKRLTPLGVGHFRIREVVVCDETPGGPHAAASVQVSSDYDSCTFWFKDSYVEDADERDLDETIIHEWLHVAWRDLDQFLESIEGYFPSAAWDDFNDRLSHEREGVVERTARALYERHLSRT